MNGEVSENTIYALYDGAGDLDLKTNYELTFVNGAKHIFIEFISYCMGNGEEGDYEHLATWRDILIKAVYIETLEELNKVAKELPHTISIKK